jgi:thiamine biosynthesis lipoprotein
MNPKFALVLAGWTLLLANQVAEPPARPAGPTAVERRVFVMGTTCDATVFATNRPTGLEALEDAFAELRHLDRILSDYDPDSELSALNAWPVGAPRPCSNELFEILVRSEDLLRRTHGAFDPAIGALTRAWDLRGGGRIPSPARLAAARAGSGLGLLELVHSRRIATRRHPDLQLDPGAFGKGAALDRAAQILRARGIAAALLDFGGQVLALGAPPDQSYWHVAIAHPSDRSRPVLELGLKEISVATSGQGERNRIVQGRMLGHILDPRSGVPVPAYGSVTVLASSAFDADALATALYVMGPDAGLAWAARQRDLEVLYLVQEGQRLRVRGSAGIFAHIGAVAPEIIVPDRPFPHSL